jgi:hypothetical protein
MHRSLDQQYKALVMELGNYSYKDQAEVINYSKLYEKIGDFQKLLEMLPDGVLKAHYLDNLAKLRERVKEGSAKNMVATKQQATIAPEPDQTKALQSVPSEEVDQEVKEVIDDEKSRFRF